jgi:Fe-S-cluster-containing hydrogenase component 2
LKPIIIYYGYTDGSGEFYVIVNAEKCNSCSRCITVCPKDALKMEAIMIDLEDKLVAAVKEEHRKKIKYTCSSCKPESGKAPCVVSCDQNAITCTWKLTEA